MEDLIPTTTNATTPPQDMIEEVSTQPPEDDYIVPMFFNDVSKGHIMRSEHSDIGFAEAIGSTTNSWMFDAWNKELDRNIINDPSWSLTPEKIDEAGISMFHIQRGLDDDRIVSEDSWDLFKAKHEKSKAYTKVLNDYHWSTKMGGAIIPALTDPYNIADIAVSIGLAATPEFGGWAGLATKLSLAGASGAILARESEKELQESGAYYNDEVLELMTWVGGGVGAASFGLGHFLTSSKGVLGAHDPDITTIINNLTGDVHGINPDGTIKSIAASVDDMEVSIGNAASISVLGNIKKSVSDSMRKVGFGIDVSGADKGDILSTGKTLRSAQEEYSKQGGSLLQFFNGFRAERGMSVEDFDVSLRNAYADFVNKGKNIEDVPANIRDAVVQFDKYNTFIREELEKSGISVSENYFKHNWDIETVKAVGDTKFVADFVKGRIPRIIKEYKATKGKIKVLLSDLESLKGASFKKGVKVKIEDINGKVKIVTSNQKNQLRASYKLLLKHHKSQIPDRVTKTGVRNQAVKDATDTFKRLNAKDPSESFHVSVTTARTVVDVDESFLKPYFMGTTDEYVNSNTLYLSGRMATQQALGFSDEKGLRGFLAGLKKKAEKEGVSAKTLEKELVNVETAIKHLWGTQMTPNNPHGVGNLITQVLLKTTTAALGLGFGLTALASESASIFARGSLKASLTTFGMNLREYKNIIRGIPPDSAYYRQLQMMSGAFDVIDHRLYNRYLAGETSGPRKNILLKAANAALGGIMKASQLSELTQSFRVAVAHVAVDDMFTMNYAKLSAKKIAHYTRMQFDHNMIPDLQRSKAAITLKDANGNFKGYDFTKLSKGQAEALDRYIGNLSRHDMLGERMHMPSIFSSNDAFSKLFTQFLGFPVQAYESLLLKGWQEADAQMAVALIYQATISSTFALAREEMEVKLKYRKERERRYTFDSEGMGNLATAIFMKNSYLAPMSLGADMVSKIFTGKSLNTDYKEHSAFSALGGPFGSRLQASYEALNALGIDLADGDGMSYKSVYGKAAFANGLVPGVFFPVWFKGINDLNKEAGE